MVPDAGHSAMEPGIRTALVAATVFLRNLRREVLFIVVSPSELQVQFEEAEPDALVARVDGLRDEAAGGVAVVPAD